jgi:uncharacterized metal-binding protein
MFGYRISFNMNGANDHKTLPGAVVSLFIFAWLAVILRYLIMSIGNDYIDRPLTTTIYENYFENVPITSKQGLFFAVGLSSVQKYQNDPT